MPSRRYQPPASRATSGPPGAGGGRDLGPPVALQHRREDGVGQAVDLGQVGEVLGRVAHPPELPVHQRRAARAPDDVGLHEVAVQQPERAPRPPGAGGRERRAPGARAPPTGCRPAAASASSARGARGSAASERGRRRPPPEPALGRPAHVVGLAQDGARGGARPPAAERRRAAGARRGSAWPRAGPARPPPGGAPTARPATRRSASASRARASAVAGLLDHRLGAREVAEGEARAHAAEGYGGRRAGRAAMCHRFRRWPAAPRSSRRWGRPRTPPAASTRSSRRGSTAGASTAPTTGPSSGAPRAAGLRAAAASGPGGRWRS